MELTKAQIEALATVNTTVQKMIDAEPELRTWDGSADVKNPTTGEKLGERPTKNVDLPVTDVKFFDRCSAIIEKIKGSGHYIRGNFFGTELVAIKARVDKIRNIMVLQFTFENKGSRIDLSTVEGKKALNEFLADRPVGYVKTNGSAKVSEPVTESPKPDPFA